MPEFIQPSFAKGEIAPSLYARVDTALYQVALRTARNVLIRSMGGVYNRPGTDFVGFTKDHSYASRLVKFQFKTSDTYMLEFANQAMRVMREGAYVTETAVNITGATAANPVVVTAASHGFSNGNDVEITGVAGMTRLNGRRFRVAGVTTNTFQLTDPVTGSNIDGSAFAAYTSGGTVSRVFTLSTPYATADLDRLNYVQSADVMTIVHRSYAPRQLTRTGHTSWTLTTITFAPTTEAPTSVVVTPAAAAGTQWVYAVTAISRNGEESVVATGQTLTGAATPDNTITWTNSASADVIRYSVYRLKNGLYGFIGQSGSGSTGFRDNNIDPDMDITPPEGSNPFTSSTDYPGVVTYYEQRRAFFSTTDEVDKSWYTQVGNHSNLAVSNPVQDDDAIVATLPSQEVNEIRGAMPGQDLLLFTSGAEWKVFSGDDSAFGPNSIKQRPQTEWGSGYLRPLQAGNVILHLSENLRTVRSLNYSFQVDRYTGDDLTELANHLFETAYAVDWDWRRRPDGTAYIALSNGEIVTMTFNPKQEVIAFTRWDTKGDFKRVCSLRTTSAEDDLYFVAKRKLNGVDTYCVEKLHTRIISDIRDAYFVDCGISFDNPITLTNATAANPVVITAASHGLSNGDEIDLSDIKWEVDEDNLGNETQPDQLNGYRYKVANAAANTFELTDTDGNNINGSAFNAYVSGGYVRRATNTFTGLDHLEGKEIIILANGSVVRGETVSGGSVTLDFKASRVHFGLPYVSDIETLNVEAPSGTIQGKKTKISEVVVRMEKTRGILIGPDNDHLTEIKFRQEENMGVPTNMFTGDKKQPLPPDWNSNGRVFIRQREPLPMGILAVIPSIQIGT